MKKTVSDFVTFDDRACRDVRQEGPMSELYKRNRRPGHSPADIWEPFFSTHDVVSFKLTPGHFKSASRILPRDRFHSKSQDSRVVGSTTPRKDFFGLCLGEAMVYRPLGTRAGDLPRGRAVQEDRSRCQKLELKKGETLLDIGCGWGLRARARAFDRRPTASRSQSRSTSAPTT